MELTPIIVTHILPTGTAFGATSGMPPAAVFIPGSVTRATGLVVGQEVDAQLVPNTMQPERTPWLAARIETERGQPTAGAKSELVSAKVQEVMCNGGVWTVATMFEELYPHADKSTNLREYNAVSSALRSMFARNHCAKFQLWRSANQSKSSREWFTCYPEKADVDEWVEA